MWNSGVLRNPPIRGTLSNLPLHERNTIADSTAARPTARSSRLPQPRTRSLRSLWAVLADRPRLRLTTVAANLRRRHAVTFPEHSAEVRRAREPTVPEHHITGPHRDRLITHLDGFPAGHDELETDDIQGMGDDLTLGAPAPVWRRERIEQ